MIPGPAALMAPPDNLDMTLAVRRTVARSVVLAVVTLAALTPLEAAGAQVTAPAGQVAAVDPAADAPTVVIRSQYRRVLLPADVRRIAVADTEILTAELVTTREVLVLGRQTGRTTLIVWFTNGSAREIPFAVQLDLTVLVRALKRIHPSIEVESAPDRDALVLSGVVADLAASMTAEAIARNYLGAGTTERGGAQPLVSAPPAQPAPVAGAAAPQDASPPEPASTQLQGTFQPTGTVINLLQLERLPATPEERIREAIQAVGGEGVEIRRMLRGSVRDDSVDTLVLEGTVPNQTALVRVLVLSAQLFAGQAITAADIRVLADEAGGLAEQQSQTQSQTQLGGGATSSLFGGARGSRLTNQVRTNLGRATAVEVAGGRLLSFIEVLDLPQVRVDVRLLEVNRTKLRQLGIDSALLTSDFRQPSLNPAQTATTVQGDQAARPGSRGAAIQNVLSFLSGQFVNEFQYSGGGAAIDAVLSLLEREGIAQSLSSPSLTVLSGEMAQVQIGGEVPVPTAFAPAFGTPAVGAAGAAAATPGVFSSVEFVPFGVQLQIRPLVGDDDSITLDVQPLVVTPDAVLTDSIRQTTGAAVATTAFQTRALRTSSKLQDGQSLLIAGLLSQNTSTNTASTPGLRSLPVLGRMFRGYNRNDQDTELVVVVNPVVVRAPVPNVALWTFPSRQELLQPLLAGSKAQATGQ
jgi:Flp pilus assembly secretin CpaC